MKKNLLKEILIVSKSLFYILFLQALFVSLLHAEDIGAQNKSLYEVAIDLNVKNAEILDVFEDIEARTNFVFTYNDKFLTNKRVTLSGNRNLGKILEQISQKADLQFRRIGENIHVKKRRINNGLVEEFVGQDDKTISGRITDENGEGLSGATIAVKGSSIGTIADVDGNYSFEVPDEAQTLIISFIGYKSVEVEIGNRSTIDMMLEPDLTSLKEIVVVGYGTKNKNSLTGAISNVTAKDLESVHAVTTSAMLAGKIPGLTFRQADGRPGSSANIQIRNMGNPLYVIDGIQKDAGQFNNISPNDIESITVLKDASASIYGSRAANGVVIVTTKRGRISSGNQFNIDVYTGWQNWSRFPETVNAGEWMTGKVDADVNRNGTTDITSEELALWQQGTEKGYQSFDWYDFIIKENAPLTSINVNATGGSDKISYYISLGRLDQSSVLGREYVFERTNLQSNVDVQINDRFKIGTQINGRIETRDQPGIPGVDDYWLPRFALFRNRPMERPYANDNPDYPADQGHTETNWAIHNKAISGYWREDWRVMQLNFNAEYDTPLKGLKVKGLYSYYLADRLMNGHEYTYDAYTYDEVNDEYIRTAGSTNPWRERGTRKVLENVGQIQLDYLGSFGDHNISATLVAERIDRRNIEVWVHTVPKTNELPLLQFADMDTYNDSDFEEARAGYVGRISYDYDGKYLVELAGRRDASWKFKSNKRWGIFPSVSLGWRISGEGFYESSGISKVINDLKIRASYGELGDDNGGILGIGSFDYITGYNYASSKVILDGELINGARDRGIPIDNISWLTSKITDIGVDMIFLDGQLSGSLDYFYRKRSGLPQIRQDVLLPALLGHGPAPENLRSDAQIGGEASLTYSGNAGALTFDIGTNFSFSRSRFLDRYKPELDYGNSLQYYTESWENRWSGTIWGLETIGQFQSMEEINSYPVNIDGQGNKTLLPGDLIYRDINGDKRIDEADRRPIGHARDRNPAINFGFNMALGWKNFDFRADFSGGAMYSFVQRWEMRVAFQNTGNLLKEFYDDRWHRADPFDPNSEWIPGKYPALRFNEGGHSNYWDSDFWITDVRYLRVRTLELGYSIPEALVSKVKLQKVRVYVNTYNLFSFDNVKHLGLEPEILDENGLQYPQNRLLNVGANISF